MASVFVNGELVSQREAKLSTFDHGFIVGDGAFETLFLHNGRPFALRRHLARLNRTLTGLMMDEVDTNEITEAISLVTATCDYSEGRIRVTVTAGTGPLGSGRLHERPSIVVATSEDLSVHETSQVCTVPWPRNEFGALVGLKTTSYAENAVALAYATERDADEAIFANIAGNLCEGSGSNVFVVLNDTLCTPSLSAGCLAGITRGLVLEFCGGIELDLPATLFDPKHVSEAFLTSAIRGVQPIATINGNVFDSVPGPQTLSVMTAFTKLRESDFER